MQWSSGMNAISTPTLLLDEKTVRRNISDMANKAEQNNITLKPHFKTHQSVQIGQWFQDVGVEKITVSSVTMAEYFADAGWMDITIAFPCNILQIDRINELAARISLSILVSDANALPVLTQSLTNPVQVYIEIDTGSDRTGWAPHQTDSISKVVNQISDHSQLQFKGFYSHPGHSYAARSKSEIRKIHGDAVSKINSLKKQFQTQYPDLVCCIGDTPCCSVAKHFEGIDEISPGNFVFYDLMQHQIGACRLKDISVALACPVVATYPQRGEIVIHGGAVHLSKESIRVDGHKMYGRIVQLSNDLHWEEPVDGCWVKSLSQEHGIVKCSNECIKQLDLGDLIGILPVHSCLTADAMKKYYTINDLTELEHMQASL
jgi:D-serine deaminase-like pyridoxal phosphate-dependent protein